MSSAACTRALSWPRTSASIRHRSGTTFVAVPPAIVPTFAVVSASRRPSSIAAIARAAATIALRPSSGRTPACAARPRTIASIRWYVGEAITISPTGVAWSKTYPKRLSSLPTSKPLAPWSPVSSETVNSSSSPTGGGSAPAAPNRRASSSRTATAALSSAPRIPSLAFVQPPSTRIGSIGASGGTVSMCAQSRIVPASASAAGSARTGCRRWRRRAARRRPRRPGARSRVSSARTQSATPRSLPVGLSIAHSAANVSLSRSRSPSVARLTARRGRGRPAQRPARLASDTARPRAPARRRRTL